MTSCPPIQQDDNTIVNLYFFKLNNWKQSYTCNMVSLFTCFQFSMSNQILLDADVTQTNSIYISATCDPSTDQQCDTFTFKNNDIVMQNTVDMSAVQRAYITNGAQKALYQALQQYGIAAFKFMKDIPHFFSNITNNSDNSKNSKHTTSTTVLNLFFTLSISLNTNISISCRVNQSNSFTLYVDGFSTVHINNNDFKQQNQLTMQCSQNVIKGSMSADDLEDILKTQSSKPEKPLDTKQNQMLFFTIVPIVLGIIFLFIYFLSNSTKNTKLGFTITFFSLGILFLISYFLSFRVIKKPITGAWFGFSNTIANCSNSNLYTLEETITYTNQSDAVLYCMSNPNYIGFDYQIDQTALDSTKNNDSYNYTTPLVPGTATFYSGPLHTFDKNQDITGLSSTNSNGTEAISFRNPYFRNASLQGSKPSDSIEGDILLDVDSGNLFYRLPSSTGYLSWTLPSQINSKNIDNIYQAYQINLDSDVPTQSPIPGPSTDLSNNYSSKTNKVYFYIDLTETVNQLSLPPNGFTYSNPCDQDAAVTKDPTNYNQIFNKNDLLIVPYPYALSDDGSSFEQYLYNQQFFIYSITDELKPNIGSSTNPNLPIGIIPGYGLIPIVNTNNYSCTFLKYVQKFPFLFWFSIMLFILSLFGFFIYFITFPELTTSSQNLNLNQNETQ